MLIIFFNCYKHSFFFFRTADKLRVCCGSSIRDRSSELNQNQEKTTPQLTGALKRPRRRVITVLGIPCTPALRRYMTTLATSNHVFCRCSVSFIPQITDLEYDQFIYRETNNKQMIVVAVVSSRLVYYKVFFANIYVYLEIKPRCDSFRLECDTRRPFMYMYVCIHIVLSSLGRRLQWF